MVKAYVLEVVEDGGHTQRNKTCCQQGSVLEVKVVRLFLYEGAQVG